MNSAISSRQTDRQAFSALVSLLADAPKARLTILFALMIASALTEGIGIMLLVPILTATGKTGESPQSYAQLFENFGLPQSLGLLLCLFVTLITLRAALQYAVQQARYKIEFGLVDRLRADCFRRLMNVEWRWMAQGRASDFSALLITNIGRVGTGLTSAVQTIATALIAFAYLTTAMILSWQAALVVIAGGLAVLIGFSGLRRRVTELGHHSSAANRAMHGQVQEGVAAIRMTKLTGNEAQQSTAFENVVEGVRDQQIAYSKQTLFAQSALQIAGATLLATIIYIGLEIWHVPVPILLPLVLVAMRLVPILATMQQGWGYWLHAVPALTEIRQLLVDLEKNAEPTASGVESLALTDAATFNAISLVYAGRNAPALDNISFNIKAKQTTAIIGASGAGKSSLADIMTGIIEPDQGVFAVDGMPVIGAVRQQWRRSISYVQQDAFLFHASIRANLLWANPDASEDAMRHALTAASADFVFAMPDRLDTVVGDGGVRLSGGERQRIALARALLSSPTLLILDEATSALDPANEAAIRRAIANLHGNMTIILIGHRLAMLDEADHVIELRDGRILRQGSPAEIGKALDAAA